MKLKTLKNFIDGSSCCCEKCEYCFGDKRAIDEEELRQEAIKWIKEGMEHKIISGQPIYHQYEVIAWIKHFFNISEEELK